MKETFKKLKCIKAGTYSGKYFDIGEIYPVCGYNNGLQLVFENRESDVETLLLFGYEDSKDGFYMNPITELPPYFIKVTSLKTKILKQLNRYFGSQKWFQILLRDYIKSEHADA